MRNKRVKLSTIVITKNAEKKLAGCLQSLKFTDEILVVDSGSTDKTVEIAKKHGARVVSIKSKGFSRSRNVGAKQAKGEWLLYIDSDERVSENLRKEILSRLEGLSLPKDKDNPLNCFRIYRKNIILGQWLKHGGWWPDPVHRLIKKSALVSWEGELHEQPVVKGKVDLIKEPIIHQSKDSITEMVQNSRQFAPIEAQLMLKAGHPPVRVYHFLLAMGREFWKRAIRHAGWLDGVVGLIEIGYQMYHQLFIYATLWQLQKKGLSPSIDSTSSSQVNSG